VRGLINMVRSADKISEKRNNQFNKAVKNGFGLGFGEEFFQNLVRIGLRSEKVQMPGSGRAYVTKTREPGFRTDAALGLGFGFVK
jgi:hypothetical protein